MKYFLESRYDGSTKEITLEQAKEHLKRNGYSEIVCTYDEMLTQATVSRIPLMYNILIAKE